VDCCTVEQVDAESSGFNISGGTYSVFDPCSARKLDGARAAVRSLAENMGAELEELKYSGDTAQCCSWGGHTAVANPDLTAEVLDNRVQAAPHPYIVYCSNCMDSFMTRDKTCVHILEAVFGTEREKLIPLQQRRANRIRLAERIGAKYFGGSIAETESDDRFIISDQVMQKMNSRFILLEDVADIIDRCKAQNLIIKNAATGSYTAHSKRGIFTYWVEFMEAADGKTEILDAYLHRIDILETL